MANPKTSKRKGGGNDKHNGTSAELPMLEHEVFGEGPYTLIFVHSFISHKGFWRMQVPFFTNSRSYQYRCVTCNLPGISQDIPKGAALPSIRMLGQGVANLIQEYGWTKVVLVGHSLGYRVVMETESIMMDNVNFASGDITVVKGVVAIDGDNLSTGDSARDKAILDAKIKAAGSIQEMVLPFFMGLHFDPNHEDLRNDLLSSLMNFKKPEHVKLYTDMVTSDADILQRLRRFSSPILILQSTYRTKEGQWTSMQLGDESPFQAFMKMHARFCKSVTVVGGHFPMLENPLAVNTAIGEFVQSLIASEQQVDRDLQDFLKSLGNTDPLPMGADNIMMDSMSNHGTNNQQ
jgi:pimeloyl-ACP methyl ester carboxylesterase